MAAPFILKQGMLLLSNSLNNEMYFYHKAFVHNDKNTQIKPYLFTVLN